MSLSNDKVLSLPRHRPQPVFMVAAIIGEDPALLRQWLFRGVLGEGLKGRRAGRERQFDAGEAFLLRLLAEFVPISRTLKKAQTRAVGLLQAVTPLARANPPFPLSVYALEAWGDLGENEKRVGHICTNETDLVDCHVKYVAAGWPHIHTFCVSDIAYELITAWDIATLGNEQARHAFQEAYLPRLPETKRRRAVAMFEDVEMRLAGRKRAAEERDKTWGSWNARAPAA